MGPPHLSTRRYHHERYPLLQPVYQRSGLPQPHPGSDPEKSEPFLCCDIAALRGEASNAEHTWFDCRVSGKEAQKLVRRCIDACEQKRKVLIQFRLGDLYADTFVYSKGDRKGETGVSLKAHLLHIGLIKIDGEEVYRAEREAESQPAPAAPPAVPVPQF